MRKQLHVVSILFLVTVALLSCVGQRKKMSGAPPTLTKEQLEQERKNSECVRTKEFSPDNRLSHYPFNTSAGVLLVSFDTAEDSVFWHRLPIKENRIDFSKITEKRLLGTEQIDSLTDIFYNYGYRGEIYTLEGKKIFNDQIIPYWQNDAIHLTTPSLIPGLYLFTMITDDHLTINKLLFLD